MRVTMIRNSTTYEFVLEESRGAKDAPMTFENPEELAAFLHPMIADPMNGLGYASLRRALYSGSAADALRHVKSEAEISRRMADVFIRAGGFVRKSKVVVAAAAAEPPKPPPAPVPTKAASSAPREVPLSELKILEITFLSDHRKLQNYSKDWKNLGVARFPKPEWRPGVSHPISHSIDRKVSIKITFQAGPPEGRTQFGTLRGKGPSHLTFESTRRSISAGENVLTLECAKEIPLEILKREESIDWSLRLEQDGTLQGGTSGPHVIYCTYGDPKDDRRQQEDGVTVKRMEQAVDWAGEVYTMDPHKLVDLLMGTFRSYSLAERKDLPSQYDHPRYMNLEGGAWPLAEFRVPAECQAIVRLVMGVIRQVGLPGEAEAILVYAHPDAPEVAKVDVLGQGVGLNAVIRNFEGSNWKAGLTDKPVEEGRIYPTGHFRLPDGTNSPGFNAYEACLKFTDSGETRLHAGGSGVKFSVDQVLRECFTQLVWFRRVADPRYGTGYRVEKILTRYR
jgi:hypothetical protein